MLEPIIGILMAYGGFRILLIGSQGGLKLSLIPIGALLFMLGVKLVYLWTTR